MSNQQIKEAYERGARAVSLRPAIARKTGRTAVRLQPGLACEITDGPWTLTASLGAAAGVTPVGPGPGTLGRGALGSCLALGYAAWAARLGVDLDGLEVVIEADYDTRGELGVADDVPPGYTEVGPVALAYSRFDATTRAEAHAEYLASIEPWRAGDGYAIPGEFVVAGGRR